MFEATSVIFLALLIDALIGDPKSIYRFLPHPVVLIGYLVSTGERYLNVARATPTQKIIAGGVLVAVVVAIAGGVGLALHLALSKVPYGIWIEALLASTLIAFRSLYDHVRDVARGLNQGLDQGRSALAHIVGRDPKSLDEAGVARAAIESAAENFSDGVLAPIFWGVLLGLPGLVMYKAINTLDSMIAHRDTRYLYFGRIAARLDDVVNFIPARIAGGLFCVAALLMPNADMRQGWICMLRDAHQHRSPNAGWQEAAVAGALGIALAGPRVYADQHVDDAWMGSGRKEVTVDDIHRALCLYLIANAVLATLLTTLVMA